MKVSEDAVAILKQFEGFRNKPYRDSRGIPTIGYGTTIYPSGRAVTMKDMPITQQMAVDYLLYHLNKEVLPYIEKYVTVKLDQHQVDALASFIYNVGAGNFSKSTLLKRINAKDSKDNIRDAFIMWNKASGKVLTGLDKRRRTEAALFNQGL